MTEEQAWFILEHGSDQGLPEYFKAIKTIKNVFVSLRKQIDAYEEKIVSLEEDCQTAIDLNMELNRKLMGVEDDE